MRQSAVQKFQLVHFDAKALTELQQLLFARVLHLNHSILN
jgi:hypothetical protein